MIDCTTIQLPGNRVVRVGTYQLDPGDGDPPELRLFIAPGWASTPPLPFGPDMVDIPASVLPALIVALEDHQP